MTAVNSNNLLWSIMIGSGVVVVLCVVILLSLLSAFVRDIDRHVGAVGEELGHLASNTGTQPHLHTTAELVNTLETEVQAHQRALAGRVGAR